MGRASTDELASTAEVVDLLLALTTAAAVVVLLVVAAARAMPCGMELEDFAAAAVSAWFAKVFVIMRPCCANAPHAMHWLVFLLTRVHDPHSQIGPLRVGKDVEEEEEEEDAAEEDFF